MLKVPKSWNVHFGRFKLADARVSVKTWYFYLLGSEQLFPLVAKLEIAVESKSQHNKKNLLNERKFFQFRCHKVMPFFLILTTLGCYNKIWRDWGKLFDKVVKLTTRSALGNFAICGVPPQYLSRPDICIFKDLIFVTCTTCYADVKTFNLVQPRNHEVTKSGVNMSLLMSSFELKMENGAGVKYLAIIVIIINNNFQPIWILGHFSYYNLGKVKVRKNLG